MRKKLKIEIVAVGMRHHEVAALLNLKLPPEHRPLTEHGVTLLVTGRRQPSEDEREALAEVLGKRTWELFEN